MKKISNKNRLIILCCLLGFVVVSYIGLIVYNFCSLKKYDSIMLPNTYIDEFDMSYVSFDNSYKQLDLYSDYLLSKKVKVYVRDQEFSFSLKDFGISVDKESTIEQIKKYQNKLSYGKRISLIDGKSKKNYSVVYKIDSSQGKNLISSIKNDVDSEPINGYFDDSNGVSFHKGINGYSLDVDRSLENVLNTVSKGISTNTSILLVGDVREAKNAQGYDTIDTMTSSCVTPFAPNTYLRNINLNTALAYINGTVIEPGQVFSYCDVAGPFNKYGYVFYYEFVGNGVCQIATTVYNAALLGGLEILKRYPHKKKSLYIAGGLDATVASYSSGWCVDMQFRNTYQYPIYIKAYSEGGRAHVEFWSNHDAKGGKEYSTESVQIGYRGYRTYLHTYKDGVEISKDVIATTWYSED